MTKKGLSIGAAMKQRMTTTQEREAPQPPAEPAPLPQTEAAPAPAEAEPLDSFNTRLPRSLHKRLKVHVAIEGRKIQDVVQEALDDYLRKFEG